MKRIETAPKHRWVLRLSKSNPTGQGMTHERKVK